jgi:tRNA(Ile)-lysidine synthase
LNGAIGLIIPDCQDPLIISAVSPLGKVGCQKEGLMSNPQPDHDAAAVFRFDEAVFHAVRRLKNVQNSILIAVSGGADSTALMVSLAGLAQRLAVRLEVASLDHGLRSESKAEVEAVVGRARQLGLIAHTRSLGLADGAGLEQRARDARYAQLETLRLERGLGLIATAHTASDQAETVLMRLGRGTALGGAAAIHARLGAVIRPLLGLTRAEVLAYLRAQGESFAEDPMNVDPKFLRVRVRRELLPLFEQTAGPRVTQHLARFAQYAAEDEALLEHSARAALERVSQGASLDAIAVDALERPIRRRVIAQWLSGNKLQVDAGLLEDILEAITQGRSATLPRDQVLVNREGWLSAEPAPSRNFTEVTGTGLPDAL